MWSRIIVYIVVLIIGHCNGVKVYTNACGTISVAEPAIDGKRVLFTFIPKDLTDISEGAVKWKYMYDNSSHEHEPINSTRYKIMAYNSSFTMDLECMKGYDERRKYSVEYATFTSGCQSSWFKQAVLDAPTECGILYRHQPERIQNADEVVLEYYAPDGVLEHDDIYVRHLRRKNSKDCDDNIGCTVDVTWFEEKYREYNSVYVYRIRNFTDEMNGDYTLQCTNRTHDNKITNYVRLVIPVAPQMPTFLNTKDIDGQGNCLVVKENRDFTVRCDVEGGTFPVYVNISIVNVLDMKECTIDKENVTCEWIVRLSKEFHLLGIRCEVSNEATVLPIATTAKLYVIDLDATTASLLFPPTDFKLYNAHYREGRYIDIMCESVGGRPTPELSIRVNGKETKSTSVSVGSYYRSVKLNYLKRKWNGASLYCCMQQLYYDEPECTGNELVTYRFSPESIEVNTLTTTTSDRKTFTQTLQCAVINANPACNVHWTYPSTLQVVIGATNETKPARHGGLTTVSTLQFNGTNIINGQKIYCRAACDLFRVSLIAKYKILITYAPIITMNASKDTIWNVGDTVVIKCSADSFPLANLSWLDTDNSTIATSKCDDEAICMVIQNVQMTDTGLYTCMADTALFDIEVQTIELAINSTKNATKQEQIKEQLTLPWIIVGIAATLQMVALAVIKAVAIVTKRRQSQQTENATESVSMEVLSQYSNLCRENIRSDINTYESLQGVTSPNTTNETNPTDADSANTGDEAQHKVVIHKSQGQKQGLRDVDACSTITQDSHNFVYADLELNTNGTTTNNCITSYEPTTEYVSIDFNRVGDVESENIYANQ